MPNVVIATRSSPLALWQARAIAEQLEHAHPDVSCELLEITTQADRFLDTTLDKIGGKGLFVKELEVAMLEGRAGRGSGSAGAFPVPGTRSDRNPFRWSFRLHPQELR